MQKSLVGFHYIVRRHVYGNRKPCLLRQFDRPSDKELVLDKITFYMEIIIASEHLDIQLLRHQFQCRPEIYGESPFRIGRRNEDHRPSGCMFPDEKMRRDAVLFLIGLEKVSEFIISHFSDKTRRHAEYGRTRNCICSRASGHVLHTHCPQGLPYLVAGSLIYMLHAAFRQMESFQQLIIRQNSQYVRKGVAHPKNLFHAIDFPKVQM